MKRLENKVALVTGGARGIGASTVKRFIAEGAKVYFTDVLTTEGKQLAKESNGQAIFLEHDVSSEAEWENVLDKIDAEEEHLDILVNNAGIVIAATIGEMTLEKYMQTISVNQVSVFIGLTHALPLLKKSTTASVINISSISGTRGNPLEVAYASSKYAVRAMTQVAAQEFAPFNIRVNSVLPGMVETPLTTQGEFKQLIKDMGTRNPLKRNATADDIAYMILFLASEEAAHITAGEFIVDGGTVAGYKL